VILAEPQRTAYDLNFQLFGFPVRIHPLFWIVGLVLGLSGGGEPDGFRILTWMMVLTVSILIHELGHALMFRRFGQSAHIVLYAMGGLAVPGDDSSHSPWSSFSSSTFNRRSHSPMERILISFAGPAAGFIFAAFVIVGVYASGGKVVPGFGRFYLPSWEITLGGAMEGNHNLWQLINYLLYVNVLWGLMNLLPIFPLDGGQISQQLFIVNDPWGGMVRCLWLSIIVAGAVAVIGLLAFQSTFMAIMFASLAASNYFTLQQLIGGGGGRPW
jgi:stage IV sporulation protein FB